MEPFHKAVLKKLQQKACTLLSSMFDAVSLFFFMDYHEKTVILPSHIRIPVFKAVGCRQPYISKYLIKILFSCMIK